jgi:hypothetical protein
VFSRSRTKGGIREALFSRRTAAFFNNTLAGPAELLEALFFASVKLNNPQGPLKNGETKYITIENNSDIEYQLELVQPGIGFDVTENTVLRAHRVTALELRGNSEQVASNGELKIYYKVNNALVSSDANLIITLRISNN